MDCGLFFASGEWKSESVSTSCCPCLWLIWLLVPLNSSTIFSLFVCFSSELAGRCQWPFTLFDADKLSNMCPDFDNPNWMITFEDQIPFWRSLLFLRPMYDWQYCVTVVPFYTYAIGKFWDKPYKQNPNISVYSTVVYAIVIFKSPGKL